MMCHRLNRLIPVGLAFLFGGVGGSVSAADLPAAQSVILTIPRASSPPQIDGEIGEDEWRHAVSTDGLLSAFDGVVHPRQAAIWLAFDGEFLYIAQRSELLPGETPEFIWGHGPYHDHNHIERLTEDLVQLRLSPAEDRVFCFASNGLPAGVAATAANTVWVEQVILRTPQRTLDRAWNPEWKRAHRLTADGRFWESEFAIPLRAVCDYRTPAEQAAPPPQPVETDVDAELLGEDIAPDTGPLEALADGTAWRLNFAREYHGFDQAFLAAPDFPSLAQRAPWEDPAEYATAVFESDAPAVQVRGLEALSEGRVAGSVRLRECGGRQARALTVTARVLKPDGGELHAQRRTVELAAGGTAEVELETLEVKAGGVHRLELAVADRAGRTWFARAVPFAVGGAAERARWAPRLADLSVKVAPLREQLDIGVAVDGQLDLAAVAAATLRLRRRGETAPALEQPLPAWTERRANLRVDTTPLERGQYLATVSLEDKDGRLLRQQSRVVCLPAVDRARDLPWLGSDAGVGDAVLPPWTPLEVEPGGGRVVVRCWGRVYTFGAGGLFEQIETAGLSLLAGPVRFEGGGLDVKPAGAVEVVSQTPATVVLRGRSVLARGEGRLQATVTAEIEYDGFVKHRIELTPEKSLAVEALRLVVPMVREHVTHLHSASADMRSSVWGGRLPTAAGVAWDSTMSVAKPHPSARMTVGSFVPSIWLGRAARGGLAFLGDSDQGWAPSDAVPAFQVIHRDEGLTELVLNLIADPRTLDQPRTIVFALEATPVKPLPPDFRRTLTGLGNTHTFTGGPGSYSHLVPAYKGSQRHPTGWDGAWTPDGNMVNSPFPADWDLNRFFNLELAKTGKLYLPYQTLNYTHLTRQLDPRTQGLEGPELWHIIGPEIECKGNGGWCMTPVHMQYRLYRYRDWIRHSSLRGFYFDNAYPILCADRGHGCGYALDDGRIQPTFTLFNMREFYKRLRTLIVAEGIEPCIMTHSTDTFMPAAYAFVDVMMDGETYRYRVPKETAPALAPPAPGATVADADVTAAAATDTDGLAAELIAAEAAATPEAREPATDPAPWRRYWSEYWPPEHFQVFGPPQHWGIMAVTMAYQKHGEEAPADQVARNGSAFLAYLLLHDTEYYLGASRGARLSQAGFDLAEEMRFLPYWEPETRRALHAPAPDVLVGGYQQGDLLLIVAFNRSRLPVRQLPVTVELGALGWGEAGMQVGVVELPAEVKDRAEALAAARKQALAGEPAADGRLTVTLDIEPHASATATVFRAAALGEDDP